MTDVSPIRRAEPSTDPASTTPSPDAGRAHAFLVGTRPDLADVLEVGALEPVLRDPDSSIFLDVDDAGARLCRMWVRHTEAPKVRVVWLYPADAPLADLKPVFRAAALDLVDRHPRSAAFLVEAYLSNRRAADEWRAEFADAQVAEMDNGEWRIWLPRFADALRVIATWPESRGA